MTTLATTYYSIYWGCENARRAARQVSATTLPRAPEGADARSLIDTYSHLPRSLLAKFIATNLPSSWGLFKLFTDRLSVEEMKWLKQHMRSRRLERRGG